MPNDMKRMNYFNGLLLKEEDLTLDQNHHKRLQRLHNRYFHDWGVVTGLEVKQIAQTKVEVSPGLALNRVNDPVNNEEISQEIVISDNHPHRVLDLAGYSTSDPIYITVSYKEELADQDLLKGGGKEIHVWEISEIQASSSKPENACKDILLARVALKHNQDGNLAIDQIYDTDVDGTALVTKAVGGATLKAKKIIIGSKEDPALPYFSGSEEEGSDEGNKLYIHAPLTEFTGNIRTGAISTYGAVDVNGVFTVTAGSEQALKVNTSGDLDISGSVTVNGPLSARSGLDVSGGMATLDVPQVVISGNMLTLNKNANDNTSSGIEVNRDKQTSAKLVWDEKDKSWKIGTDENIDDPESGMHKVAYGKDWELLHNGSHADDLHKHSQLHSAEGSPVLSTDAQGNILIEKSLSVSGSLISKNGGLEVSRGETLPNAKIAWNEEAKTWQIGTANGNMTDIPDGKQWEELTSGDSNADALHTHRQFHNEDKSLLALEIAADGHVNIPHELMVGETLTVNKLIVREEALIIKKVEQEVTDSFLTVNKAENEATLNTKGGLDVYRGAQNSKARMEWNETDKKWKIGLEGSLSDIPYGHKWDSLTDGSVADSSHKHSSLSNSSGGTVLSADDQGHLLAAGDLEANGTLQVNGNTDLQANLNVDGSATIEGDLTVKGKTTYINKEDLVVVSNRIELNKFEGNSSALKQSSIEVYRGKLNPSAKLVWDENDGKWKLGLGDELANIAYGSNWDALTGGVSSDADGLHRHISLSDSEGNTAIQVNAEGNIEITNDAEIQGTLTVNNGADVAGGLAVEGSLTVDGNLIVKGTTTTIEREDLVITNNMIEINKFDGDVSNVNESGLEVYRGESQASARIIWNESERKWKVGIGSSLENIASGSSWDKLTQMTSADSLHMHSQIYNSQSDILALSASAEGDVDVHHDLTVGSNLTVAGNLEVRGLSASINTDELHIGSPQITLNKKGNEMTSSTGGGLEVYRGIDQPMAQINWDEDKDQWKIGTSSGTADFIVDKDGNVAASGGVKAASATIHGAITAASAAISGTLTVGDGLEVLQDTVSNAQIKWVQDRWKLGTAGKTVLSLTRSGKMGVGTDNPTEVLDVAGKAIFRTETEIAGAASFSGKVTAHNEATFEGEATFNKELNAVDVVVSKSLTVSGSLVTSGLEAPRGQDDNGVNLPNARIFWNNDQKAWFYGDGVTQSELGTGKGGQNKLYNELGDAIALFADAEGKVGIGTTSPLALLDVKIKGDTTAFSVTKAGNVGIGTSVPKSKLEVLGDAAILGKASITGELTAASATISKDLTVTGNLTVNGDLVTINTATLEVEDNIIRVNKYVPQATPLEKNAGVEVFRGGTALPAQFLWDETIDQWVAGVSDSLKVIEYKGHTHPEFANIIGAMTFDSGNIGIGTAAPTAKLDVNGNVVVTGKLTAIDIQLSNKLSTSGADISNTLTAKDAVVSNSLTVKDVTVSNKLTAKDAAFSGSLTLSQGIEVNRGTSPKAQISWAEADAQWQVGVAGNMKKLAYSDHTHQELTELTGVLKIASGNIGIGTTSPTVKLDVSGDAAIAGRLTTIDAAINNILTAKDATISNTLTAKDAAFSGSLVVSQGIEVSRGVSPKAQVSWDEATAQWQVGVVDNMKQLAYSDHTHSELSLLTGAITVDTNNNVGIGKMATDDYKLDVDGNLRATNFSQTSSRTFKENITGLPTKKALELLNKLKTVTFNYKADQAKRNNIGFIAEDVPHIFATSDHKSVVLMDIIGVLTTVVQKHQKEAIDMQKQVNALQIQVAALAGA